MCTKNVVRNLGFALTLSGCIGGVVIGRVMAGITDGHEAETDIGFSIGGCVVASLPGLAML